MPTPLTPKEKRKAQSDLRKDNKKKAAKRSEAGWDFIDYKTQCWDYNDVPRSHAWALPANRNCTSKLAIFKSFIDEKLITAIFNSAPEANWYYKSSKKIGNRTINFDRCLFLNGRIDIKRIYYMYAHVVRVFGLQNKPSESEKILNPMEKSFKEASGHFKQLFNFQDADCPGYGTLFKLFARFQITDVNFQLLSNNFRDFLSTLGQAVAGDEKLYHMTGNSGNSRQIITKPDKVGLWFFQLCCLLANEDEEIPFLIFFALQISSIQEGVSTPVNSIVKLWVETIRRVDPELAKFCILCFDSYYLDNTTRLFLRDTKQPYIASAKSHFFGEIYDRVKEFVSKPGEYKGVWRNVPNETSLETFVYAWDKNEDVGKKCVLSNAFVKEDKKGDENSIPIYDDYKSMFAICDHYNRNLCDRKWPHRAGGNGAMADHGTQNAFSMACILQNTFNAYRSINKVPKEDYCFKAYCLDLADRLYESTYRM